MRKIIRCILYGLALTAGVVGLFVGGVPLVKYLVEILRDYEYRNYYDTHYLNEPEIIFLLSLILLIGVRICFALDKRIPLPGSSDESASEKKSITSAQASATAVPSATAEVPAQPAESADEKLTRLLNQKKD